MAALLAVVDPLLKWGGPLLVTALYARLELSGGVFPVSLPFALQVAAAALIAEFGFYWAHRLHHSRPALWWLHAPHHGSQRLYSVNNFRLHPLNYGVNHVFGMLPLAYYVAAVRRGPSQVTPAMACKRDAAAGR